MTVDCPASALVGRAGAMLRAIARRGVRYMDWPTADIEPGI
jgi:hypothetical protein